MDFRPWHRWALVLWLAVGSPGCGGSRPAQPSKSAAVVPAGQLAFGQATQAPQAPGASEMADGQAERPGLATQFGEDLARSVQTEPFYRESSSTPFVTTTIWYNDASGAEAIRAQSPQRSGERAEVALFNGGLVVSLIGEQSQVLPGFRANQRTFAIGEANARYAIRIENLSDFAFEAVASVDGLSVTDGRPAAFERRGYILRPHDEILIEGFRTSRDSVAAFRFGKVSQAYSVEMGYGDRNVGVVGVAFFEERGTRPVYNPADSRLRENADPFPGNYAPRPSGR